YGPNVESVSNIVWDAGKDDMLIYIQVEGATWQRHRKITAPPFNERNSEIVWASSLAAAHSELAAFLQIPQLRTTSASVKSISLNVLSAASALDEGNRSLTSSGMSYREALQVVSDNMFTALALPRW